MAGQGLQQMRDLLLPELALSKLGSTFLAALNRRKVSAVPSLFLSTAS